MNKLIMHVAKCKLRLYAWARFFFVEPQLQIIQSMVEETIISRNIIRNSQFAESFTETMSGKYTSYWMEIDQNSFKNEGWTCAAILQYMHYLPLGTCEEEFFIAL